MTCGTSARSKTNFCLGQNEIRSLKKIASPPLIKSEKDPSESPPVYLLHLSLRPSNLPYFLHQTPLFKMVDKFTYDDVSLPPNNLSAWSSRTTLKRLAPHLRFKVATIPSLIAVPVEQSLTLPSRSLTMPTRRIFL